MEQIFLEYDLSKENVTAIMLLYKNAETIILSSNNLRTRLCTKNANVSNERKWFLTGK